MSKENVEAVRAIAAFYQHPDGIEQLARGDFDPEPFGAEIEWDATATTGLKTFSTPATTTSCC